MTKSDRMKSSDDAAPDQLFDAVSADASDQVHLSNSSLYIAHSLVCMIRLGRDADDRMHLVHYIAGLLTSEYAELSLRGASSTSPGRTWKSGAPSMRRLYARCSRSTSSCPRPRLMHSLSGSSWTQRHGGGGGKHCWSVPCCAVNLGVAGHENRVAPCPSTVQLSKAQVDAFLERLIVDSEARSRRM